MRSTLLVVVRLLAAFICLPAAFVVPVSLAAPRTFDVLHYAARIEPDIAAGTISGTVVVNLTATADGLRTVELDRGELTIDAVRERGVPVPAESSGRRVVIQLSNAAARGDRRALEIEYHGTPRFGLELAPDRTQAYTIFSTSQWMVVVDSPEDRATLQLSVVLPPELVVTANGRHQARRVLPGGKVEHEWRLDTPAPTYTFGFVAGAFNEVDEEHDGVRLRYLGDGFSDGELRDVFADTGAMIDFFAERAGVPYFGDLYTQALVVETIGQENTGFSVMSEDFGRAALADPGASSLAAHELAHQWWGNMVTCRDWTHFWLNEGFATFMAAAWEEQRFGRGRYESRIAASRERYERVRDAGGDRSLVFPDWNGPTSDDRTLVYQKGAYVLHLLREHLGDDAFWAGLRVYTRRHFGGSVTTADFQSAMEESSGRDLSDFFDEWIYLRR